MNAPPPSREKCPGWGGPHLMTRALEKWRCSMCGLTVRPTNERLAVQLMTCSSSVPGAEASGMATGLARLGTGDTTTQGRPR